MSEETTMASRRIYSGRVLNLDVDTVRFPDGSIGDLEMIRHSGASAVVPLLSEGAGSDPQVLLIRQFRYAAGGYLYEIPAGRLEADELPVDCAHRELREETGCVASTITPLLTFLTTPGFTDERIHIFLATGLTTGKTSHEATEFIEVCPVPLTRALAMVQSGEIQDAKTIIGLLYAAGFRLGA